jgi:hypothetical protein
VLPEFASINLSERKLGEDRLGTFERLVYRRRWRHPVFDDI